MQKHRKLTTRILSLVLSVSMVATMTSMTAIAVEDDNAPLGTSSVAKITHFDKLSPRFEQSTGTLEHIYSLSVKLGTTEEDLPLPLGLSATVVRTVTTTPPDETEATTDSEVATTDNEVAATDSEAATTDSEVATTDSEVATTDNEVAATDSEVAATDSEVAATDSEVAATDNKVAATDNEVAATDNEVAATDSEVAATDNEVAATDNEVATTDNEVAATDNTTTSESFPVTWSSDKEYKSDESGQFVYTANISDNYILADGVQLPEIHVFVGNPVVDATPNTIIVGGGSATEGYETANYVTLSNAFTSLENGSGTVQLGANIVIPSGSSSITLTHGGTVTLDLAGHNITSKSTRSLFRLEREIKSIDFTIMDSATGGSIVSQRIIHNWAQIGNITITGGTLECSGVAIESELGAGKITVTGGTIQGTSGAIYCEGEYVVTVSGGTVKSTIGKAIIIFSGSHCEVTVSGGTVESTSHRAIDILGPGTCTTTISGTAVIKSGASSVIYLEVDKPFLEIKDTARVENTSDPVGAAVYFGNPLVNAETLSEYYTQEDTATVVGEVRTATVVEFTSLTANGEANKVDTTELTLEFDKDVEGLELSEIMLYDDFYDEAATPVSLTKEGVGVYKLVISDLELSEGEELRVHIYKHFYSISPYSMPVTIHKASSNDYEIDLPTVSDTGDGYTLADNVLTLTGKAGSSYRLRGNGHSKINEIVVTNDVTVTLHNVRAPLLSFEGSGTSTLKLTGNNSLDSGPNNAGGINVATGSLVIENTTRKMGHLRCFSMKSNGINVANSLAINSGNIESEGLSGISASSTTINGGIVTATGLQDGAFDGDIICKSTPTSIRAGESSSNSQDTTVSEIIEKHPDYVKIVYISDYVGTEAKAPTNASKTTTSITLAAVNVTNEAVEYAKSTTNAAPSADSDWQTSTTFAGLTANTTYYFFARVQANEQHNAGAVSTGTAIRTNATGGSDSGSGGGGGGGSSSSPTPPSNTITTEDVAQAVSSAVKKATAGGSGSSTRATFNNIDSLAPDIIKSISDVVSKEVSGKAVSFKLNFDAGPKNKVSSRITIDPLTLFKELAANKITGQLALGVNFDQAKDAKVQTVNKLFNKHFDNKIVSVVYEQKAPLAVNAEFCAKLSLVDTFGNGKQLHFYTYNNSNNTYKRISSPNYWVDKNNYAHITAPFGGSLIITDKPLTKK